MMHIIPALIFFAQHSKIANFQSMCLQKSPIAYQVQYSYLFRHLYFTSIWVSTYNQLVLSNFLLKKNCIIKVNSLEES